MPEAARAAARPPELLLGSEHYGPEIDMWSVGCIFAELLVGKPVFPGKEESNQMDRIGKLLGTPNEENMPGCPSCPGAARGPGGRDAVTQGPALHRGGQRWSRPGLFGTPSFPAKCHHANLLPMDVAGLQIRL